MEWIQTNWLALVILVVSFILWLIYLHKNKNLRKAALYAILEAERLLKSSKGQEKMKFAVEYVYSILPAYTKFLLSEEFLHNFLENFIQKVFDEVKKLLDYRDDTVVVIDEGGKK